MIIIIRKGRIRIRKRRKRRGKRRGRGRGGGGSIARTANKSHNLGLRKRKWRQGDSESN